MESTGNARSHLMGKPKGTAVLYVKLAIYHGATRLTVWLSSRAPRYVPEWTKNIWPEKTLYMKLSWQWTELESNQYISQYMKIYSKGIQRNLTVIRNCLLAIYSYTYTWIYMNDKCMVLIETRQTENDIGYTIPAVQLSKICEETSVYWSMVHWVDE